MTTSRLIAAGAVAVTGVSLLFSGAAAADTGDLVASPSPTPPTVTMVADNVTEGTGGSNSMAVHLHLDKPAAAGESVKFFTMDGQGSAMPLEDHEPVLETVVFAAGQTERMVQVPIVTDDVPEANEHIMFGLHNPSGLTIGNDQTSGIILDDDAPSMSIDDVAQVEGDAGTNDFVFTVSLSEPSTVDVFAFAAPTSGTASVDEDFWGGALLVEIPAGSTETTVAVPVVGDTDAEGDETFNVELSDLAYAVMGDASGLGTILDDDGPGKSGGATGNGNGNGPSNGNGGNSGQVPPVDPGTPDLGPTPGEITAPPAELPVAAAPNGTDADSGQTGSSFPPYFFGAGAAGVAAAVLRRLVLGH